MAYYFKFTDGLDRLNTHPQFEVRFSGYRNILRVNMYAYFVILIMLIWIATTITAITTDRTIENDHEDAVNDEPDLDYNDDYDTSSLSGVPNNQLDLRTLGELWFLLWSVVQKTRVLGNLSYHNF